MFAALLGVGRRFDPDTLVQIEHGPGGSQHLAFAGTSQHQQPDGIGGDGFSMFGQRRRQAGQFLGRQESFAFFFTVLLDARCRIALDPFPAHGQVIGLAQHLDDPVGPDRRAAFNSDLAVQGLHLVVGDLHDLVLAKLGQDQLFPHDALVHLGAFRLAGQMIALVSGPEIFHRRCRSQGMPVAHGILALVDQLLQIARFATGGLHGPVGIVADGDPPLSAQDAVIEDEGFSSGVGDPKAEALHLGVPEEHLGAVSRAGSPDQGVGNLFGHRASSCQHYVNTSNKFQWRNFAGRYR